MGFANVQPRDFCPSGYYYSNGYCYTSWGGWGRWVFLAILVVSFILAFFLLACIRARRRRQAGLAPSYGTGWLAPGNKYGYGQNNANQGPAQTYQPPPPQYSAQPANAQYTGTTFNPNDGYYGNAQYGGQQEGIQLQQPPNSYQREAQNVYEPPAGPPPAKK
ncbi:hypothetical protein P8C59_006998 [Phyllachora maydis]|uniref:Chitin synthesis regulation, Congo red resistance, RCR protein n=1 Tax=Phyllachora maydis TaxID=1825666 RepID=A0AAD9MF35_9PEZI|nr:hypothetical protein P8C59_006998 [Phyllachora maydis]